MTDIIPINGAGGAASVSAGRSTRLEAENTTAPTADRVEISEMAQLLSTLEPEGQSRVRAEKVAEIREALANGTYETEDKIDYVVSRLMDVLSPRLRRSAL